MAERVRTLVVAAVVAALIAALSVPMAASAGVVKNVVHRVVATVQGGGSTGAEPSDRSSGSTANQSTSPTSQDSGTPPNYVPPAHGTNPHGQGTVGVVDLTPEGTNPLPYDAGGGSEDIVVGQARGEQSSNGDYHGHITIAALLGNEIIGVDTNPGQTEHGPLDPIQTQVLDALCDGSGNQICISVLTADSTTTNDGSTNHFAVANANLGGPTGITASAASSDGNISDDGQCQTATGDSNVANANVGGALTADALSSSTSSQACNDGTQSQNNSSQVVNLNDTGLPVPAPGCADGTPNTNFTPLDPLLSAVCNADDSNGAQAKMPYGVREALTAFVLNVGGSPLVKLTTAAAESAAQAPGLKPPPPPPPPPCDNPPCKHNHGHKHVHGGGGGGQVPAGLGGPGANAGPGGNLPFTGANLVTMLLIALSVMGAGLGTMAYADQRRQARTRRAGA